MRPPSQRICPPSQREHLNLVGAALFLSHHLAQSTYVNHQHASPAAYVRRKGPIGT